MKVIIYSMLLVLVSCSHTYTRLVDASPLNYRKFKSLEVSGVRGRVGLVMMADQNEKLYYFQQMQKQGRTSRAGIEREWGRPDRVWDSGGLSVYCYSMESPIPGPTILKFKNDQLVYIEAWFENDGRFRSEYFKLPDR